MYRYNVKLNPNNLQVHLDIEADIQRIQNGVINFVIKVNRKDIVDYVLYENITARNTQFTVTPVNRKAGG